MKTDRDDAPYYLRNNRRSRGTGQALAAGLVCAGLVAAALYLPSHQEAARSPAPRGEQVQQESRNAPNEPTDKLLPKAERQTREQTAIRQTHFNDANYTPRQPANVVSMEAVLRASGSRAPTPGPPVRQQNIDHVEAVIESWDKSRRYVATWTAVNNRIDGRSVCANHKRGSIDYRECRKAAKQHFKDECRLWDKDRGSSNVELKQRYCSAANGFSPMG